MYPRAAQIPTKIVTKKSSSPFESCMGRLLVCHVSSVHDLFISSRVDNTCQYDILWSWWCYSKRWSRKLRSWLLPGSAWVSIRWMMAIIWRKSMATEIKTTAIRTRLGYRGKIDVYMSMYGVKRVMWSETVKVDRMHRYEAIDDAVALAHEYNVMSTRW